MCLAHYTRRTFLGLAATAAGGLAATAAAADAAAAGAAAPLVATPAVQRQLTDGMIDCKRSGPPADPAAAGLPDDPWHATTAA